MHGNKLDFFDFSGEHLASGADGMFLPFDLHYDNSVIIYY